MRSKRHAVAMIEAVVAEAKEVAAADRARAIALLRVKLGVTEERARALLED